jgi:hypothetical protein
VFLSSFPPIWEEANYFDFPSFILFCVCLFSTNGFLLDYLARGKKFLRAIRPRILLHKMRQGVVLKLALLALSLSACKSRVYNLTVHPLLFSLLITCYCRIVTVQILEMHRNFGFVYLHSFSYALGFVCFRGRKGKVSWDLFFSITSFPGWIILQLVS